MSRRAAGVRAVVAPAAHARRALRHENFLRPRKKPADTDAGNRSDERRTPVVGLVADDEPLVIAQNDAVRCLSQKVIGANGDFAAASGCVNHKLRNRKSRRVASEALHDFNPLPNGSPQVFRSFDRIALVKVVRPDPDSEKPVAEGLHDRKAVVDSSKEHTLIIHRNSSPLEPFTGQSRFPGDFPRVIEVRVHPERTKTREHFHEPLVDPMRKDHRESSPNANDLDRGNGAQLHEDPFELRRGENERISSGN
jgi:hypothetical protein